VPAALSRNSYDEVPYPSYPLPQTHPDHLASVGVLVGLEPPRPDGCRVLELGCASGGNLIPLALTLPGSSFVGVDLSRDQIAAGRRTIAALGLRNIDLRPQSILEVDESLGTFDYVLCHGVYSWVPPVVQAKILDICHRQLAVNGMAYISYNTHPGWHLRGVIRHMMHYHVGRYPHDPPDARVARARRLLDFLARAAPERDRSYAALLRDHADLLRKHSDAYLFHEHLEEHNDPVWFLDFCERLAAHGLRYIAEAEFGTMIPSVSFEPEVQRELDELAPNLCEKEQYMDFARNRSFRQTLVGHDHLRPDYGLSASRVGAFHVASPVHPVGVAMADETAVEFTGPEGLSLDSSAPIVKCALAHLGEAWPRPIRFDELFAGARARLVNAGGGGWAGAREARRELEEALLATYLRSHGELVRLWLNPPPLAVAASERPVASPLARLQALEQSPITNLMHEIVPVTPFDRHLLPLLDGTRDRAALLDGLMTRFQQGLLNIVQEEQPVTDAGRAGEILRTILEQQLPRLASLALLMPAPDG
jgi:methyltransferase-like protein/cyclopropane fatty-acyl-phospholipid synthase-like methyltransferase